VAVAAGLQVQGGRPDEPGQHLLPEFRVAVSGAHPPDLERGAPLQQECGTQPRQPLPESGLSHCRSQPNQTLNHHPKPQPHAELQNHSYRPAVRQSRILHFTPVKHAEVQQKPSQLTISGAHAERSRV